MRIKELENYNILSEMCSLILNNTKDEELIKYYSYYFVNKLEWLNENKSKIVSDFTKLYLNGNFNFALKYWNMQYTYLYSDIVNEGVSWFDE